MRNFRRCGWEQSIVLSGVILAALLGWAQQASLVADGENSVAPLTLTLKDALARARVSQRGA